MVCNLRFKEGEYKAHIRSDGHALGVKANDHIYNEIDALIAEMDLQIANEKSLMSIDETQSKLKRIDQS